MKIEINVPQVGKARLITTEILASSFSGLFLAPGLLGFPGADLPSLKWVAVIVAGPQLVGAWSLLWAERRIRVESVSLRDEFPQRAFEAQRQTTRITEVRPARAGEVLEGEVLL